MSLYQAIITWKCPENDHLNQTVIDIPAGSLPEAEESLETFYQDPTVMRENPCLICQDIGFNEVETKLTCSTLDEIGLKYVENPDTIKGKDYQGGDKTSLGHNFTLRYDQLFQKWREQPINLLELGILRGRSLAMWSDYFPKGQIYGLDCYLKMFQKNRPILEALGAFKNQNVQTFECNLTDQEAFQSQIDQWPNFQIILDDALHQPKAQYQNFLRLFPKLNPGGIYVVEDIEKPQGFVQHFGDLLAGVSNQKSNYSKNHKLAPIISQIEAIEIRTNNIIIHKKL